MNLGIKQLNIERWTEIIEKYCVNSRHTGVVVTLTNFGVFIDLDGCFEGMIYKNDLLWTRNVKHPSEFCAVGDILDVIVLKSIIKEEKLSLGHKQTRNHPFFMF